VSERPDGMLEVGRIGKAHGIRGEVYVDLTTDRVERLDRRSRLWARGEWLEVESAKQQGRRWLVRFVGVADRTGAERLTGSVLEAEPIDDPAALWVHELIGDQVIEVDGTERGICVAVVDNPAADLLELDDGSLVPVTFVTSHDGGTITIDPPEGLFD
jgi:16S rRNA processing protein RimM